MMQQLKSKFKETEIGKIPEDWEEAIFSEVVDINPIRELKKNVESKFISMGDIERYNKKIQGYIFKKYKGGSKFINHDTLMARITPCLENGKTAYVDILSDGEIGTGSTEFIVLSAKEGKTISEFVYYLAISPEIRTKTIKSMTGTSGRQRVENDVFDTIIINLPFPKEQKSITKILSDLDSKIELNQQMNKTLEAIGQAIFKRWFIDFEFPNEEGKPYKSSGGEMVYNDELEEEIPKGWEALPFSEVVNVNPSRRLKKGTVTKKVGMADLQPWQSWIQSYQIAEYSSGPKFKNGDILFARITPSLEHGKTALVSILAEDEIAFGTTEFIIFSPKVIPSSVYIFNLVRDAKVREIAIGAMTGSSGRQRVPNECFDHIMLPVPPEQLVNRFDNKVSVMYKRISNSAREIDCFTQLRDSLLPKLMSGKIRVSVPG